MQSLTGACSCGAVKFQVSGSARSVVNCHCNLCRKMNGSAFSTYVAVAEDDFEVVSGGLKTHQCSGHAKKSFCAACGTPIFNSSPKHAGLVILYFGTLDDALQFEPAVNIFCESKLNWVDNLAEMPSLPQGF